ncbi:hypothetical protein DL95DRAFT_428843 [Leptodontidium sp. 2 PMI_412]|nr:hypothetical protein DL95DRAFT_428843 [Leptodontidium sp. 2 PMI_412]
MEPPACRNCIKYSVQCDFLASLVIGSGNGLSRTGNSTYNSPLESGSTPNFDQDGRATVTLNTSPSNCMEELNVTQVGFSYDFVMRGILALSALHMAHHKPERRDFYIQQAMLQHETGLRVATEALATITEENCTGVYAFSALPLFFTLASPRKPGDLLLVGENRMADWLFLVKGTSFIPSPGADLAEKLPQDDPLVELGNLIAQNSLDELNKHVYLAAIDTLRRSFAFHNQPGSPGYKTRDVFTWIFKVPKEFLQLLRQHTQESLTIFAYFCVSSHLVSKIWNLLDEEHQLWIQWPLEEIGWIPGQ